MWQWDGCLTGDDDSSNKNFQSTPAIISYLNSTNHAAHLWRLKKLTSLSSCANGPLVLYFAENQHFKKIRLPIFLDGSK